MMNIYDTVRRYIREGLSLDESIAKAENVLHTTFTEQLKNRIKVDSMPDETGTVKATELATRKATN
jgi:hypothetical protein